MQEAASGKVARMVEMGLSSLAVDNGTAVMAKKTAVVMTLVPGQSKDKEPESVTSAGCECCSWICGERENLRCKEIV